MPRHWRSIHLITTVLGIIWGNNGFISAASDLIPEHNLDFVENILSKSTKRRLEDNAAYPYDLSSYSIRFGKCQYVKMYDDQLAEDEDNDNDNDVFAMKHFVVFRLCPSGECGSCDQNYGEYVVEVEDYLEGISEYYSKEFENMCKQCDEDCEDDGSGEDCSKCLDLCDKYDNMEENGYVDASDYIECKKLDIENDDEYYDDDYDGDDDEEEELQLYAGPRCGSDGTKIAIGVFSDENCWEPYDADLEELIGYKVSYYLLKNTFSSSECTSCMEVEWNDEDDKDKDDEDEVAEMCENIYDASAKCETKHGFDNGLVQVYGYENQVANEFSVCTFIDSLIWESYDQTGEIQVGKVQDVIIRKTTTLQKATFSLLSSIIIGLGFYAYHIHKTIDSESAPVELAYQGQLT